MIMPIRPGRARLAAAILLAAASGARADGVEPVPGPRADLRGPVRSLPPEVRHRERRTVPMPRHRLGLAPLPGPSTLIHAYLPRPTELPIYNEPPPRFPRR